MAGLVEARWSRAARWSRRLAVLALAVAVIGLGSHNFGLIETPVFIWTLFVAAALAIAALLLVAAGFQRVWYSGDRGGADLTLAVVLSSLLLAPFCVAGWLGLSHPALNDVTTDLDDPPAFRVAQTFRLPPMNPLTLPTPQSRADQERAYPELTGRRYGAAFDQITAAVETLMQQQGWKILSAMPENGELEITVEAMGRLPIIALPFDVAVRITDEGNAAYVDMRSASRFGGRDMGTNAGIVSGFLKDLDAQVSALAAPTPAE